jgi:hypothetical protein
MKKIGDGIEFTIISDIYGQDYKGDDILVRARAESKYFCKTPDKITSVEQVFEESGRIKRGCAKIVHEEHGSKTIKANYKDVVEFLAKEERTKINIPWNNKQ